MNNTLAPALLLVIASGLLWLAVTGKLSQLLDGIDVAIGKDKAVTATSQYSLGPGASNGVTAGVPTSGVPTANTDTVYTLPDLNPLAQLGVVTGTNGSVSTVLNS